MSDEKIIELLKVNKTDRAFSKLYTDFPKVKKMILSKGGTKDDAEDIFQEALIILYNKVNQGDFKLTSKIGTYLYSVSRFLWKDQLIKNNKTVDSDFSNDQLIETNKEELEEIIKKEEKLQVIEQVLKEISQKCQEIFELFYFKKLSMKDIAIKMKYTSERVARTQKYKCVEQAKKKIVIQ